MKAIREALSKSTWSVDELISIAQAAQSLVKQLDELGSEMRQIAINSAIVGRTPEQAGNANACIVLLKKYPELFGNE